MAEILVVDDKMGLRELLSEILGDEGHAITLAENARQAREARLAYTPDLVLLAVWMPDTDGVTLLREWKYEGLLTMPVIMMSGNATIDIAVEAMRIGAEGFLEKPITLKKLLKAVQQGLSRTHESPDIHKVIRTHRVPQSLVLPSHSVTATSGDLVAPVADLMDRTFPVRAVLSTGRVNVIGNGKLQSYTLSFDSPLREARDNFERMYFEHLLHREEGSMTRASAKAGLKRVQLYRKLKQLGTEPSRFGSKKQEEVAQENLARFAEN